MLIMRWEQNGFYRCAYENQLATSNIHHNDTIPLLLIDIFTIVLNGAINLEECSSLLLQTQVQQVLQGGHEVNPWRLNYLLELEFDTGGHWSTLLWVNALFCLSVDCDRLVSSPDIIIRLSHSDTILPMASFPAQTLTLSQEHLKSKITFDCFKK